MKLENSMFNLMGFKSHRHMTTRQIEEKHLIDRQIQRVEKTKTNRQQNKGYVRQVNCYTYRKIEKNKRTNRQADIGRKVSTRTCSKQMKIVSSVRQQMKGLNLNEKCWRETNCHTDRQRAKSSKLILKKSKQSTFKLTSLKSEGSEGWQRKSPESEM